MQPVARYFREVFLELRKVTWPTREQTIEKTTLVIGISVGIGLYLGLLDFVFQRMLRLIIG